MFSFVITTIRDPNLLVDYHKQLKDIPHNFIVVPDKKTPIGAKATTKKVNGEYLERDTFGIWNDDARRMEGILRAIERKDDFIILLDDDNYLGEYDIYTYFSRVGNVKKNKAKYSENRWVNIWEDKDLYPRGFPINRYHYDSTEVLEESQVVVNAGLWECNPDIDAIYCLTSNPIIDKETEEFALGEKQFCPFNSQNTSILTETLPGYFFPKRFNGSFKLGRYGDIFAGIFYEVIMHHLGGTVLFGKPYSKHVRNTHNFLKDLEWELMGMIILNDIVPELEKIELKEKDWGSCLYELVSQLKGTRKETKEYLDFLKRGINKWLKALQKVS